MSCDKQKHEVCLFRDGNYICACPHGYGRLPDGRCLVINECEDSRLNDCSQDAECIDQAEGFVCQCKTGFADVSPQGKTGMLCRRRMNECARPSDFNVDCDSNAVCVDTEEGFSCRCRPGFADISESFNKFPGRKCIEAVNECLDPKLNDCAENSVCEDAKEGYTCKCRSGFVDASANSNKYPGRVCNKPVEQRFFSNETLFSIDTCDPHSVNSCKEGKVCTDRVQKGTFVCDCPDGSFFFEDGTCRQSAACKSADCDKNAFCVNVFDSYRCQCRPGYFGNFYWYLLIFSNNRNNFRHFARPRTPTGKSLQRMYFYSFFFCSLWRPNIICICIIHYLHSSGQRMCYWGQRLFSIFDVHWFERWLCVCMHRWFCGYFCPTWDVTRPQMQQWFAVFFGISVSIKARSKLFGA